MTGGEMEADDVGDVAVEAQNNGAAARATGFNQRAMMQAQLMGKSTGLAAILALVFGGVGLLYASIPVGIVCTIIEVILFITAIVTLGIGMIFYIPWHMFCVILALVLVSRHNKRLIEDLN
ncbi:MAG: hypothetical protein LUC93_12160 [Planctomycetaceae bacterium]|nr:hypothetical protein [Planctomycetaceae bacterium]